MANGKGFGLIDPTPIQGLGSIGGVKTNGQQGMRQPSFGLAQDPGQQALQSIPNQAFSDPSATEAQILQKRFDDAFALSQAGRGLGSLVAGIAAIKHGRALKKAMPALIAQQEAEASFEDEMRQAKLSHVRAQAKRAEALAANSSAGMDEEMSQSAFLKVRAYQKTPEKLTPKDFEMAGVVYDPLTGFLTVGDTMDLNRGSLLAFDDTGLVRQAMDEPFSTVPKANERSMAVIRKAASDARKYNQSLNMFTSKERIKGKSKAKQAAISLFNANDRLMRAKERAAELEESIALSGALTKEEQESLDQSKRAIVFQSQLLAAAAQSGQLPGIPKNLTANDFLGMTPEEYAENLGPQISESISKFAKEAARPVDAPSRVKDPKKPITTASTENDKTDKKPKTAEEKKRRLEELRRKAGR